MSKVTTVPPRPAREETPTFLTARRTAPHVMRHYDLTSLLVWVMYANDRIGLHKFNRNGTHKEMPI